MESSSEGAGASFNLCKNCGEQIPCANFVMHVAYCERNLIVCNECGERVTRRHLIDHERLCKEVVDCDFCNLPVLRRNLESHVSCYCEKRNMVCNLCKLPVPASSFEDHWEYCSNRTEKCDLCGNFIKTRYLENYSITCSRNKPEINASKQPVVSKMGGTTEIVVLPCEFCGEVCLESELETHQMVCSPYIPLTGTTSPSFKTSQSTPREEFFGDLSCCCTCGAAIPRSMLADHQRDCQSLEALPCEFCKEKFPLEFLEEHQINCTGITRFPGRTEADETRIPCESCGCLIPVSNFASHESNCTRIFENFFPGPSVTLQGNPLFSHHLRLLERFSQR